MKQALKYLSLSVAASAVLIAAPSGGNFSPISEASAAALQEAASKPKKTRKVPAMTLPIYKRIQKAQEAMDVDDLVTAEKILNDLIGGTKPNQYERAVAWQLIANISFEKDDTPGSIRAFEEILKLAESVPEALELNILFSLAQLYYSIEQYDRSLDYIGRWETRTELISVSQLVFISQIHFVKEDYRRALDYIYRAISDAETVDTVEVQENWYNIALSAHWELGDYNKVREVLEILIINWPKPLYWVQLAGIYGELGLEEASYSITEAAYKQGFLDDNPQQLVNMAQILIAREAPIKAAWVLEKAYKENRVEDNADNARLLGQAYLRSSEFEKAVGPLKKAAAAKSDGSLWFQVGQIEIQMEHYNDAIATLDKAIAAFRKDKSSKKKNSSILTAYIQKGSAHTELKKFKEARKALEGAKKIAKTKREKRRVDTWLEYMKAEEAREKILADAGLSE